MGTAVSLRGITKTFGDVRAVDDVSLELSEGDFVTLVGPSGCGKTTLLRMVAGLESPTKGEIEIFGRSVFSSAQGLNVQPHARGIGMVFQSYALWPHMTAFDNVAFPLRQAGTRLRGNKHSRSETRDLVTQALSTVDCEALADRYPGEMSGGQQQRVALARAIVGSPKLILMDEPLSNLDAKLRARLRFELRRIQQELGFTTLYVTHDRSEAISMSDTVVVLRTGHVEQQGSPVEVYEHPVTSYVSDFLGDHNLLHGRVGRDASGDHVETTFGTVAVPVALARGCPSDGCLSAAVPRGAFRVTANAGAGNATICGVAFCGWYSELLVRASTGEEVTVRVDGRSDLRLGDRVDVVAERVVAVEPHLEDASACSDLPASGEPSDDRSARSTAGAMP